MFIVFPDLHTQGCLFLFFCSAVLQAYSRMLFSSACEAFPFIHMKFVAVWEQEETVAGDSVLHA